jgi:hypothetical protein
VGGLDNHSFPWQGARPRIRVGDREQVAPTFEGSNGFRPMFYFADATGETLAALLRRGNAGANTMANASSCWTPPSPNCPSPSRWGTGRETMATLSSARSWCGLTRPAAPKDSSPAPGVIHRAPKRPDDLHANAARRHWTPLHEPVNHPDPLMSPKSLRPTPCNRRHEASGLEWIQSGGMTFRVAQQGGRKRQIS